MTSNPKRLAVLLPILVEALKAHPADDDIDVSRNPMITISVQAARLLVATIVDHQETLKRFVTGDGSQLETLEMTAIELNATIDDMTDDTGVLMLESSPDEFRTMLRLLGVEI